MKRCYPGNIWSNRLFLDETVKIIPKLLVLSPKVFSVQL